MIAALMMAPLSLGTPVWSQARKELSWAEVARRARPASALVTLENFPAEATAFCVDPSGLFVTNYHVIEGVLPPGLLIRPGGRHGLRDGPIAIPSKEEPKVNLILNSNQPDQKVLRARVLWTDPDWDLALLRIQEASGLVALPLAPDSDLGAAGEVLALGFPFGKSLAAEKSFPAVNITHGQRA